MLWNSVCVWHSRQCQRYVNRVSQAECGESAARRRPLFVNTLLQKRLLCVCVCVFASLPETKPFYFHDFEVSHKQWPSLFSADLFLHYFTCWSPQSDFCPYVTCRLKIEECQRSGFKITLVFFVLLLFVNKIPHDRGFSSLRVQNLTNGS